MLPMSVVPDRARGGSFLSILIAAAAMFAIFFFLTFYLQQVHAYSPVQAGLSFLPHDRRALGDRRDAASTSAATARPAAAPPVTGMALGTVGMGVLAQLTVTASYVTHVLPGLLVLGMAMGLVFATSMNTATARVARVRRLGVGDGERHPAGGRLHRHRAALDGRVAATSGVPPLGQRRITAPQIAARRRRPRSTATRRRSGGPPRSSRSARSSSRADPSEQRGPTRPCRRARSSSRRLGSRPWRCGRLNHAVLYVRDVARPSPSTRRASASSRRSSHPGAAFLRASGSTNDHDLGLFEIGAAAAERGGHVDGRPLPPRLGGRDARELAAPRAARRAWARWSARPTTGRPSRSTPRTPTASSSRCAGSSRRTGSTAPTMAGVAPLDLDAELARYGAETVGGLGVSWPAG